MKQVYVVFGRVKPGARGLLLGVFTDHDQADRCMDGFLNKHYHDWGRQTEDHCFAVDALPGDMSIAHIDSVELNTVIEYGLID